MKENSFVKALFVAHGNEIKRIREDNQRMKESCIGVDEMIDLATGKQKKPRAVRDWEQNNERR